MENEQKEFVTQYFQDVKEKAFLLTEFIGGKGDITAPVEDEINTYIEFIRLLKSLLDDAVEVMKR
jgi:hypothetical protein